MTGVPVPPAGIAWYPDPMRRAPLRGWSPESGWASAVSDGRTVWSDPRPIRRGLVPADLGALRFIEHVFLPEAHARGALTVGAQRALLAELTAEAEGAATTTLVPAQLASTRIGPRPLDAQQSKARPEPSRPATPRPVPQAVPLPIGHPPRPSATSRWFAQARASAGSDLAVHGLAYLGVLLLFIGVFGLVAFAFGDVTPGLRPVAELACAVVPFAAARQLLPRGAVVAGRALEVVGGLLLPVMVITSAVDGFGVPPDLTGGALAAALTSGCVVVAVAYAAWVRGHPASGLRFAVAPALWFAVAAATLGAGRPVPSGQGVAVPTSWQVAAVAAAVVLTLALARRWPRSRLAEGAVRASVPGTVVVAVLAALTCAAQGWPGWPVGVTGALVLGALVLLRGAAPAAALDLAAPVWWALVGLALAPSLALGALATLVAAGFLVLLELAGHRGRSAATSAPAQASALRSAVALPAAGLLGSVVVVWSQPLWATGALAVLTGWAVFRRTRPYATRGAAPALDAAAAALPAATALALTVAVSAQAGLAAAAALVLLATLPATRRVGGRGPDDGFWPVWWRCGAPLVVVAALGAWSVATSAAELWIAGGALLAIAGASVVGPLSSPARSWVAVGLTAACWLIACDAAALPVAVRGVALAAGALAVVAAAHASRRGSPAALGLAGHATAAASLALAGPGWALVAALGLATLGFAITAIRADGDRSPVGAALAAVGGLVPFLPWAAVAAAVPVLALAALDAGGVLPPTDPWAPAVLAATALGYAGATRTRVSPRCGSTLGWAGFAAAALAVAGSRQPWPAVLALAALIGSVLLLAPARRAAPMRWAAWAAIAPLVGVALDQLAPWFGALPSLIELAATLALVGGAMLIAAAGLDLRGAPWVPRWRPRRAGLLVPAALGAGELAGALLLSIGAWPLTGAGTEPGAGFVTVAVAVSLVVVGALARAGILAGVAVVVGWLAALQLAGPAVGEHPLVAVAAAGALLLTAQGLGGLGTDRAWWSRWDSGVLIAAAPVALTALGAAADGDQLGWTCTLIGLQTCAVAVRLRSRTGLAETLGWSGTALVLVGAGSAGSGWVALALLAVSAVHTGLAVRARGDLRAIRQLTGAAGAVAAWVAALAWLPWSSQVSVDVTAAGAGAIAVAAAGVARAGRLDRSWVAIWGGAAALVSAGAAVASVAGWLAQADLGPAAAPSGWVVLGLAELSVAFAAAAGPLQVPWLRDLCVAAALASLLAALAWLAVPAATTATVLAVLASLLAALTLAGSLRDPAGRWTRAGIELGAAAAATAILIGLAALPAGRILVPAVAAAAVQAAAAGVARSSVGLQLLSPVLGCAAWLLFVADAAWRAPQWCTVAIGLSLLVIAGLWRRDRRRRQADPSGPEVVGVELVGIAFLVGASFVQAITLSVAHAFLAAALGIAVAAWGALSQVRRRVAAGAVVVLASLVVAVAVPLVALLPGWGGAWLWVLIAVAGLIAVVATTLIERGRTAVGAVRGRLGAATTGWE